MTKLVCSNAIKAILSLPLAKLTSGCGQYKLSCTQYLSIEKEAYLKFNGADTSPQTQQTDKQLGNAADSTHSDVE